MEASSRIFVKGLPASLTVEEFRKHFSQQSPITDAKFLPHRRIGYVGFRTPEDAARAVKYHNRSFIRMSKIGVEMARSVDERQQALGPFKSGEYASKMAMRHVNTEHHRGWDDTIDTAAPATKKRRLSAKKDERDVKLQEFLQVMQPPGKSKAWDNHDVVASAQQLAPSAAPEVQTVLAADEKSDLEYEPVPKKQKSLEKKETIPKDVAPEEHVGPPTDNASGAQTLRTQGVEGGTPRLELEVAPAATDDDWLRSRTNRLLGLIDDDEVSIMKPSPQQQEKLNDTDFDESLGKGGRKVSDVGIETEELAERENPAEPKRASTETEEPVVGNDRLFLRNLTYTSTEDDIREHFESNGFKGIKEIHLPLDLRSSNGSNKGFAHVQFTDHQIATRALKDLDQKPFQGRLLHILPSNSRKPEVLDDFAISKLPLKQQQYIRRKAEAPSSSFNWNSMYMSSDAVISSISDRLGVAKSALLDPTSSDAAVKQAHAETHIIQETKSYFMANGVNLDAFKNGVRGGTAILVKNFPFSTKTDELRNLFDTYGPLKQLLMPPSGTIAMVEFEQVDQARFAFSGLSYSKFKGSILFLEKAPQGLFTISKKDGQLVGSGGPEVRQAKPSTTELLGEEQPDSADTATLFVRNLNFTTTDERLREAFEPLDGFMSGRIKIKPDPKKKGATLSMGFGFLEFRSKKQAQAALGAIDGYKLDGHELLIRASHKAADAAEQRRNEDRAKKMTARKTKIIIKNLPFEATKRDVRSLFGAYGQLQSVRVPKKFDSSTRGFAFADFITAREAENAMDALRDTHLLGRRLVLQFAAEEEMDPEAAIEQMQKKVGKQADKVALQKLTGTGRKKFNVEGADGLDQLVD